MARRSPKPSKIDPKNKIRLTFEKLPTEDLKGQKEFQKKIQEEIGKRGKSLRMKACRLHVALLHG